MSRRPGTVRFAGRDYAPEEQRAHLLDDEVALLRATGWETFESMRKTQIRRAGDQHAPVPIEVSISHSIRAPWGAAFSGWLALTVAVRVARSWPNESRALASSALLGASREACEEAYRKLCARKLRP